MFIYENLCEFSAFTFQTGQFCWFGKGNYTAWKCTNTEFFMVLIFLYLDWIRGFTEYSVRIQENAVQKKFLIWTLFTQCEYAKVKLLQVHYEGKKWFVYFNGLRDCPYLFQKQSAVTFWSGKCLSLYFPKRNLFHHSNTFHHPFLWIITVGMQKQCFADVLQNRCS